MLLPRYERADQSRLAGRGRGRRGGDALIAILDAAYGAATSAAACLVAKDWASAGSSEEHVFRSGPPADYQPGEFYRRELPLLLGVLALLPRRPEIVVIDGYVWLDGDGRKGLGAHLFEALHEASAIVGIAKTRFADAEAFSAPVIRGRGASPLFVTSVGIERRHAADGVTRMHGPHRIPALVKRAEQLARQAL